MFFSCPKAYHKAYFINMAKEKKFQRGYSRLELILLLCIALVVIFLAIPIYNSWYGERQPIAYPDPEQKEVDPWNSGNEENATESEPLILPTD